MLSMQHDLQTTQEYNISFSSLNRSEFLPSLPQEQRISNGLQDSEAAYDKKQVG